ncbi:MAG: hypothetical protein ABIA93_03450 [Candidatus Woesearchaeota archaeon]
MGWTDSEDQRFYSEFRRKHPWFFDEEWDEQSLISDYEKGEA